MVDNRRKISESADDSEYDLYYLFEAFHAGWVLKRHLGWTRWYEQIQAGIRPINGICVSNDKIRIPAKFQMHITLKEEHKIYLIYYSFCKIIVLKLIECISITEHIRYEIQKK